MRSDQTIDQGFGGGGEVRGLIDGSLLDEVRDVDGVRRPTGSVDGYARIIDKDGDPVGDPAMGAPTFGANWRDVDALNPFTSPRARARRADDEVVIDRASADATGYEVGDTVPVQTRAGASEFTLVGIARLRQRRQPRRRQLRHVDRSRRRSGSWASPARSTHRARWPPTGRVPDRGRRASATSWAAGAGVEVVTGEQITEESQDDIQEALSFFTIFLLVFAVIAVVVGAFVIYNAFSIIVAQRTREMALLRAVGARRRQVRRAVLARGLVVGHRRLGRRLPARPRRGVRLLSALLGLPDSSLASCPVGGHRAGRWASS